MKARTVPQLDCEIDALRERSFAQGNRIAELEATLSGVAVDVAQLRDRIAEVEKRVYPCQHIKWRRSPDRNTWICCQCQKEVEP